MRTTNPVRAKSLEVTEKIIFPDATEQVTAATGGVPSGLIALWHGTIGNIPAGWLICDGNNDTPNLLARFIQGVATAATNPGATGGAATVALSTAQLASHTHGILAHNMYDGLYDRVQVKGSNSTGDMPTKAAGSGSAHANEPPFYDVAFLMKT